jgi:hypothetical protein
MHARHDPPSDFTALVDELAAFQDSRAPAEPVRARRIARQGFDPHRAMAKSLAADAALRRAVTDAERVVRQVTGQARRQAAAIGPEAAALRLRQQRESAARGVGEIMAKAMTALASGRMTAVQVAALEARAHRVMAQARR